MARHEGETSSCQGSTPCQTAQQNSNSRRVYRLTVAPQCAGLVRNLEIQRVIVRGAEDITIVCSGRLLWISVVNPDRGEIP